MDQLILDLFGEYAQLVLAIVGVCAAVAAMLPAPKENSGKVYRAVYRVLNWLGANVRHAKNASAESGKAEKPGQ